MKFPARACRCASSHTFLAPLSELPARYRSSRSMHRPRYMKFIFSGPRGRRSEIHNRSNGVEQKCQSRLWHGKGDGIPLFLFFLLFAAIRSAYTSRKTSRFAYRAFHLPFRHLSDARLKENFIHIRLSNLRPICIFILLAKKKKSSPRSPVRPCFLFRRFLLIKHLRYYAQIHTWQTE